MGFGFRIICSIRKKNRAMHAAASRRIGFGKAIFDRRGRTSSNPGCCRYRPLSPLSIKSVWHWSLVHRNQTDIFLQLP